MQTSVQSVSKMFGAEKYLDYKENIMFRRRRVIVRGDKGSTPAVMEDPEVEEPEVEEEIVAKISKAVTDDDDDLPVFTPKSRKVVEDVGTTIGRNNGDEEDEDEDTEIIAHEDEEDEEDPTVPVRKSKVVVEDDEDDVPVVTKKAKLPVDDDEDEAVVDIAKGNTVHGMKNIPRRASTKAMEPEVPEEPKSVAKIIKKTGANPVMDIMELMETGKALLITKESEGVWIVNLSSQDSIVAKIADYGKLSGKQYFEEVANNDYIEWSKEWKQLTYSEKKNKALKLGVVWTKHPNPKVDVMRITDAVRQKLGIQKYKPEYATRLARSKIRG